MSSRTRLAAASLIVVASMALMFTVPPRLFTAAALISTGCMLLASLALGGYWRLFSPRARSVAVGLLSAGLLYGVFLAGNAFILQVHPLGLGSSSEASIYSLITSPSNPIYLQVGVLLFDALGYESFFRGVLQGRLQNRTGAAAPFAVAAIDASIHLLTFNPLWVVTTFIVDSVWGLTFFYTRDLSSSMTSHFVWDIAIFLLLPIR